MVTIPCPRGPRRKFTSLTRRGPAAVVVAAGVRAAGAPAWSRVNTTALPCTSTRYGTSRARFSEARVRSAPSNTLSRSATPTLIACCRVAKPLRVPRKSSTIRAGSLIVKVLGGAEGRSDKRKRICKRLPASGLISTACNTGCRSCAVAPCQPPVSNRPPIKPSTTHHRGRHPPSNRPACRPARVDLLVMTLPPQSFIGSTTETHPAPASARAHPERSPAHQPAAP